MTQTATKPNRGPAAAAENRAALLAAARRLFAERGYHAPLSAIAREAGVGQGSLYRHFPQRELIAAAILEEKDRKSTRLNSSHVKISYAVFCLKKNKSTND